MTDSGFGVSSTFGGVAPSPNLGRVAANGLRYTNFNSTALCSPTRAALITGRNYHSMDFRHIRTPKMTPWPEDLLKRWDQLTPDQKELFVGGGCVHRLLGLTAQACKPRGSLTILAVNTSFTIGVTPDCPKFIFSARCRANSTLARQNENGVAHVDQ
jgi:hypothetical protein